MINSELDAAPPTNPWFNKPKAVMVPVASKKRKAISPPPFVAPPELKEILKKYLPAPLTSAVAPRSQMQYGVRLDICQSPMAYLELLEKILSYFPSAVSVFPSGEKGYIDVGFHNNDFVDLAVNTSIVWQNKNIPVLRTRCNRLNTLDIKISNLPTTLHSSVLKRKLEFGFAHFGDFEIVYEVHPAAPSFVGFRALVILKLDSGLTPSCIPGQAFFPSAPFEPFTMHIDGIKTKQVDNIVALGENIKNLTGFTPNFEILSNCQK